VQKRRRAREEQERLKRQQTESLKRVVGEKVRELGEDRELLERNQRQIEIDMAERVKKRMDRMSTAKYQVG
jgi:hypothetical protein